MKTFIQGAFLLIAALIVLFKEVASQEYDVLSNYIIETKPNKLNKSDFAIKYEINYNEIKSFYPVKANLDKLLIENDLSIKINDEIIKVKKNKLIKRGLSSISFFGNIEDHKINNIILTINVKIFLVQSI